MCHGIYIDAIFCLANFDSSLLNAYDANAITVYNYSKCSNLCKGGHYYQMQEPFPSLLASVPSILSCALVRERLPSM